MLNNLKGIGINADAKTIDGDLDKLEKILDYYSKSGFDYVEIPPHGLNVILNGFLIDKRANKTKKILENFNLKYTMHIPNNINLGEFRRQKIHYRAFKTCIEYADYIKADLIVYHSAVRMPYEEKYSLKEIKELEAEQLRELADYADKKGIKIALENGFPDKREIATGERHTYSSLLAELAEQIKKINKTNVGICLDIGHAYLSSNFYNMDFIESIKNIAPHVIHFHVHDNFGVLPRTEKHYIYLHTMGEGDLHLPVGWGCIPYYDIFSTIAFNNSSVLIVEIEPRFYLEYKECLLCVKNNFIMLDKASVI
ncbi:sugar phosphate isomerase/epimerase [Peptococcaceae bacterium]|nr:sugar phosphate isomerase/epimerase [Peptococcaceae bacterium]